MNVRTWTFWFFLSLIDAFWLYGQEKPKYEYVGPHGHGYQYDATKNASNNDLHIALNYQYADLIITLGDRQPSCELIELLSRQTGLESLVLTGETQSGANAVLSALHRPLTLIDLDLILPGIDSMRSQLLHVARVRMLGLFISEQRPVPAWIFEMPSLRFLSTNKCHTLNAYATESINTFTTVDCYDSTDYAATSQQVIEHYESRGVRVGEDFRETGRPNVSVDTVAFESAKLNVTLRDPTVNEIVSGLIAKGMMQDSTYVYQKGKEYHYNVVRCTDDGVLLVAGKYKYSGTLRDRFLINIEYSDTLRSTRKE